MNLRKAIKLAKKNKCRIKNENLKIPMICQDAKSLIVWLISDTKNLKQAKNKLKEWYDNKNWELDFDGV